MLESPRSFTFLLHEILYWLQTMYAYTNGLHLQSTTADGRSMFCIDFTRSLFFARKQPSIYKFWSGNTPLKYALVEKSANRKALHPQDYRLTGFLSKRALALASASGYQVWSALSYMDRSVRGLTKLRNTQSLSATSLTFVSAPRATVQPLKYTICARNEYDKEYERSRKRVEPEQNITLDYLLITRQAFLSRCILLSS
jgi:hypothetical protein